jgi:hypothetical protein
VSITLNGTSLPVPFYCVIGDTYIPAVVTDNTAVDHKVICLARNASVSSPLFGLSINGQDKNMSGISLTYMENPTVSQIIPILGPITGDTIVHLYGSGMLVEGMVCRFGDIDVAASYHSVDHISCISPTQEVIGQLPISISVNGYNYISTGFTFQYIAAPSVTSISPSFGPDKGGSRVYIHGTNFGVYAPVMCEFGSSKYRVSATRESEGVLSCITPEHAPEDVEVRLSYNSQQWINGFTFSFHSTVSVFNVNPSFGSMVGGYTIQVQGSNFKVHTIHTITHYTYYDTLFTL